MATYNFITNTGVIVADTSTTLATVQQEYRDDFNDQELDVETGPLARLIAAEVDQRTNVAQNNAMLANQMNPNFAGGQFFDSIFALTNGERLAAQRTTVTATLGGISGRLIPAGSAAQTVNGDRFTSQADATVGIGGTVDAVFQSDVEGVVNVAPGELTQILDSVLGWDSITNAAASTPGRPVETDGQARARRRELIALQGVSVFEAVFSNLRAVAGVRSISFRQNVDEIPQTIDGVLMARNSIYACVDGGSDVDVATALLNSKTDGTGWNNGAGMAVSQSVTEPITGQNYTVLFDRPNVIEIDIRVTVRPLDSVIDPTAATRQSVQNYANGNVDDFTGFTNGSNVDPFDIAAGINADNASLNAVRVEVRLDNAPSFSTDVIDIEIFQRANVTAANITVVVQ